MQTKCRGPEAYLWFAKAAPDGPGVLDEATERMVTAFGPERLAAAVRPWYPDVTAPTELFVEIDTSRWRRTREHDWRRLIGVYRDLEERTQGFARPERSRGLDRLQLVLQPKPREGRPLGLGWSR